MGWREDAEKQLSRMPEEAKALRKEAMDDLWVFAQLVNPGYMYGEVHKKIYRWMMEYALYGQGEAQTANKLVMLPRAHLKSHMVATWCAWVIARHPEISILYVSATSELAETQLFDIKNILESSQFRLYWPEYIHPQEGKRETWNNRKIRVDHVQRSKEGIRDATIATAGLTTNTTGWHADVIVADDLVVPENAYTEDGRDSVVKKASQFTSIRNAGGFTLACGTRYHPHDIYATWRTQQYETYDDNDELLNMLPTWEIVEHKVEDNNVFLWPREVRDDGKAFGFNLNTLSRIRSEYEDKVQFHAQYYNDPNDPGSNRIKRDRFQYVDQKSVTYENGSWSVRHKIVNIYAAMDFAYTLKKASDYTAIVVVGVDPNGYIYVLDIDRFKADRITTMFERLLVLHDKWNFRKLRAEVTAAQSMIVNDLKDKIREENMSLSIDEHRPTRHEGTKEERMSSILEPRYDNMSVFHIRGGYTAALEEELILARPKHDDIKDALASVIEIAKAPSKRREGHTKKNVVYSSRFGGVGFNRRYK